MTPKKKTSKPASEPKIEIKKAADFKSFYVNWAQAATSPFDVVVVFGEGTPDGTGGMEIEQKARVIFSPLEAKMVAYILTKTLRQYETTFGEIKIPKQVAAQVRELMPPKNEAGEENTEGD